MKKYNVIGLMSGTSLDGLDIAFCEFTFVTSKWVFEIKQAETIRYSKAWQQRLTSIANGSAIELVKAHIEYGELLGKYTLAFITKHNIKAELVASHGHTVFHQPAKKITFQLGSGAALAGQCGLSVASDFRSLDVALGGQGAPLVPIGDRLLFHQYDYCLNLGGFANISSENKNQRIAYDICPVNIVLNELSRSIGKEFDRGGMLARKGTINIPMLEALNKLPYYKQAFPKSLGREWVEEIFMPVLKKNKSTVADKLCTVVEHVAIQVGKSMGTGKGAVLITGGGAYNDFLMERIKANTKLKVVVPGKKLIEFKEAMIFAFLGVLRMRNEHNCLSSVTGASQNNTGGSIYHVK